MSNIDQDMPDDLKAMEAAVENGADPDDIKGIERLWLWRFEKKQPAWEKSQSEFVAYIEGRASVIREVVEFFKTLKP